MTVPVTTAVVSVCATVALVVTTGTPATEPPLPVSESSLPPFPPTVTGVLVALENTALILSYDTYTSAMIRAIMISAPPKTTLLFMRAHYHSLHEVFMRAGDEGVCYTRYRFAITFSANPKINAQMTTEAVKVIAKR